MFAKVDLKIQSVKLFAMLDTAIKCLRNPDQLVPTLKASGARHVHYGVVKDQYAIIGENLLATLTIALEDLFTTEVAEAWTAVYGVI